MPFAGKFPNKKVDLPLLFQPVLCGLLALYQNYQKQKQTSDVNRKTLNSYATSIYDTAVQATNQRRNISLCLLLKTFFLSMCPLKFLETIDLTLRPAGRICGSKKGKDPWPARNPKHRAPGWGYLYVLCTSISELPNYLQLLSDMDGGVP